MNKILIIAYYYPPKGGAGVQRTVKFAKYLNKKGFKVHVLTVQEERDGIADDSLTKDIDEDIVVHRTSINEPKIIERINKKVGSSSPAGQNASSTKKKQGIITFFKQAAKKVFFHIYNLVYIPDDKKGWIRYAVKAGEEIIKENDIRFIYSTSGPYTSHIIGYKLSKACTIKWIADFRDAWVTHPFADYGFAARMINSILEGGVVKKADRIISVSKPIIGEFITRYKSEKRDKFIVIPNGYDEEDFNGLNLDMSLNNSRFTILYNGTIYGKRSPQKIQQALDDIIMSQMIPRNKIKLKFVGQIGNEHKGIVAYYMERYNDVIEFRDYVPHEESLSELCKANALLLIIDEGKGSEGIYTGKIFEYIRTGKPIIGVVPDGVARELIETTKTGYTAYPNSIDDIKSSILKAYNDYLNMNSSFHPEWAKIKKYSRDNLTVELINAIEDKQQYDCYNDALL
jgi:glycosyltransferase involved in cell wall biosynthesis